MVHEPVAGMAAVDEAEVGGGLVEAEELLAATACGSSRPGMMA